MDAMAPEEWRAFLEAGTRTANGARNDVDGELLFRVRLDHVVALSRIAD